MSLTASPSPASSLTLTPLTPAVLAPKSLAAKLADVMAAVDRVPKRGRNDFHHYDYATEADIAAVIRQELASRSIILVPEVVSSSRCPVGEKGDVLTTLDMIMEFRDGETGETLAKRWQGYGTDKSDKGGYKAMTGAEKYFLLKTFLLPTGDDPEADDTKDKHDVAPNKRPLAMRPDVNPETGEERPAPVSQHDAAPLRSTPAGDEYVPVHGKTFPIKDQLKQMGGKWDKENKVWTVPSSRVDEAYALLEDVVEDEAF